MHDDVKRELDLRLVRGELTRDEYRDILATIGGPTSTSNEVPPSAAKQAPQSVSPQKIIEACGLTVFNSHFEFSGKRYEYRLVKDVAVQGSSLSINLIPISRQALVIISFENDNPPSICVSHDSTFMQHITSRLRKAGAEVADLSFPWRYQRLATELLAEGRIQIAKDVYLSVEGTIESPGHTFSISEAANKGALLLGTFYKNWSGRATESKPSEVFIGSETSRRQGNSLRFEILFNVDVTLAVLREFASRKVSEVHRILVDRATVSP